MKKEIRLEDIERKSEDIIKERMGSKRFCKILVWLKLKFEKDLIIYISDLQKFLGVTYQTAYFTMRDLCMLDLVYKEGIRGNFTQYHPVKNNGHNVIDNYFEEAKGRLGL